MSEYALYRFFDASGSLLYVGCSKGVFNRIAGHRCKPWAKDVVNITIRRFENKIDCELAEIDAIKNESPKYNIAHNGVGDGRSHIAEWRKQQTKELRAYVSEKLSIYMKGRDIRRVAKETSFTISELERYMSGQSYPRDYNAYRLHQITGGLVNFREMYPRSYLIKDLDKKGL